MKQNHSQPAEQKLQSNPKTAQARIQMKQTKQWRKLRELTGALAALCLWTSLNSSASPALTLQRYDHIALVGNALADRMQHFGHLESLIHARYPQMDLVFRNLAVPGDEVAGFESDPNSKKDPRNIYRQRSSNFGTSDEWLTKAKADVVLAFYGYNESFAGSAGIPKFKEDLARMLSHIKAGKYNGKEAPRLVLFSPIAAEKADDPNLPDPDEKNENMRNYKTAMAEVAKANGVPFIDLMTISGQLYKKAAPKRLTMDTVHMTEAGDKLIAPEMFRALFDEAAPGGNLEKLRSAINDKNAEWHARYRTVDGFNVFGGRSHLEFKAAAPDSKGATETAAGRTTRPPADKNAPKISNYQVMQEEMIQRDIKTANRDRRIWAVARGGDLEVDDSNLPKVTQVPPNVGQPAPYLDGQEAIKKMTAASGCKVTLFADEKRFPELANPVQMAWDTKGRLWVAVWPSYPERTPSSTKGDSILIFKDTNGDGVADKCIHFADNLNCPTGFQIHKDGILLMQAPDLWYLRDTNGDGKADWKERVLMGLDSADSHHTANSLVLDPGGATYLSDGVFHRTQVESISGPVRNIDGAIYRFEPATFKFERYVSYGFANPHGRAFDYWGSDIITDGTGNANYFAPAFSGYIEFPAKHPKMQQFWDRPSRPCAGTAFLSSRHFPDDFNGNFLNCNVIGNRAIFRVRVSEDGSGLKGSTLEDLVKSEDPNFRPVAVGVAPDGSVYFLDWSNQLIGHMQHHIRDPHRDKSHGRIYRITYPARPLLKPVRIDGQSIERLLEALQTPEDGVRTRAKIELSKHDSTKVFAAMNRWITKLDPNDNSYQHHLTEALWVHQWRNVVDEKLLLRLLRSPDFHARAAATRVLCYWRDRLSDPLKLLEAQAVDESPRVRLEAVRACSFFKNARAAEVALSALEKESNPEKPDYYIKYCLEETMKTLDKYTK